MPKKPHDRISIERGGNEIAVDSPYHPDFIEKARSMNGDWNGDVWVFDARDEEDVRETLVEIYGTDGVPVDYADVKADIEAFNWSGQDLFALGRQIARRKSRDEPVTLGDGVRMENAGFRSSGGSRQCPEIGEPVATDEDPGAIVRDVPLSLLENFRDERFELLDLDTEGQDNGLSEKERGHVRRLERAFSMFGEITQGQQGIQEPFLHFDEGTPASEIYSYFEEDCGVLLAYLTGDHDHPFKEPDPDAELQ